jgi:hypothetical protein
MVVSMSCYGTDNGINLVRKLNLEPTMCDGGAFFRRVSVEDGKTLPPAFGHTQDAKLLPPIHAVDLVGSLGKSCLFPGLRRSSNATED